MVRILIALVQERMIVLLLVVVSSHHLEGPLNAIFKINQLNFSTLKKIKLGLAL